VQQSSNILCRGVHSVYPYRLRDALNLLIARVLVDADPALMHDRERLLAAVKDKDENGGHTIRVEFTQREIEAVNMRNTHEPRA
jgi:hypothetical protein